MADNWVSVKSSWRVLLKTIIKSCYNVRNKKTKSLETIKTLNTDLMFSCAVYMVSMDQLGFSTLFNYEFAPVSTSLFKDSGDAR